MPILSFSWSTRRDGNDGYVLEVCEGAPDLEYRREFGPMPPHIVPAFVASRRGITAIAMENDGAIRTLE